MIEENKLNDFEKMISIENLYRAHLRARNGHRHKGEVIRYELRLMENLEKLSQKLRKHQLKKISYYHFQVHEPKTRDIYATNYETRILLHSVCGEVLGPALSKRLIYDNAACQKGKGTHFALKRMSYFMTDFYRKNGGNHGFVLKCDIHKYFDSINHQVLKEKLRLEVKDSDVMSLLEVIIDSYHAEGRVGQGLPLGNQTSQWFAIFYLDRLDRLIKEQQQIVYYLRYMDDFVMIHQDKAVLKSLWLSIVQELAKEKLFLNQKTQITKLSQGVTFLGFRFSLKSSGKVIRRLRGQSKVRMNRRLKKVEQDYEQRQIGFEKFQSTMMSYKGHLKYGTVYHLRKRVINRYRKRLNELSEGD